MGWHTRHASTHVGAGGAFTLRDAKPNGLESCSGTPFMMIVLCILSDFGMCDCLCEIDCRCEIVEIVFVLGVW